MFRHIPHDIPALGSLNLPPILNTLVLEKRGLILLVGATGTGKSTTLASMLEQRNQQMAGHILTIEDPMEFLFTNKRSMVNQREVGRDTQSLQVALKNALRQAPDCILHRRNPRPRDDDRGDLVLAVGPPGRCPRCTRNNSYHALGRILSFYSPESRPALLADLARPASAIVSQRLVRASAGGRMPAVEVLLNTKLVAEFIEKGDFGGVKEAMEKSLAEGSQTFEAELARLITEGDHRARKASRYADSPTNLMWRLANDMEPVSRQAPEAGRAGRRPAHLHRDHARRAGRTKAASVATRSDRSTPAVPPDVRLTLANSPKP